MEDLDFPVNVTAVFSEKDLPELKHLRDFAKRHKVGVSKAIRMLVDFHRVAAPVIGDTAQMFEYMQQSQDDNTV